MAAEVVLCGPLSPVKIERTNTLLPDDTHEFFQFYRDTNGNLIVRESVSSYARILPNGEPCYFPLRYLPQMDLQMMKTSLYQMQDKRNGEIVAAKNGFIDPILHEANVLGHLTHPNIVSLVDMAASGKTPGNLFIILEWLPGGDLDKWIQKGGYSLEEVASVIDQTSKAIDYANEEGYIYCDAKPKNIMFGQTGRVKVVDFEITQLRDDSGGAPVHMFCTPSYAAPEQYNPSMIALANHKVYPQTDVYSLGAVLFDVLTRQYNALLLCDIQEFTSDITRSLPLSKNYQNQISSVMQIGLESILKRALAFDFRDRYQTVREFNQELQAVLSKH